MRRASHMGVPALTWALVWALMGVCDAGVGVWMDDGNGRTVLADNLGSEEAAELARDILDVLDLPAPPQVLGRHHHHMRVHRAHGSAPTWLKGVYDTLDEHGHATSAHMDATHRATVTAADTIITFVSRGLYKGVGGTQINSSGSLIGVPYKIECGELPTEALSEEFMAHWTKDPPENRLHGGQHGGNKRMYFDVGDVPLDHSLLGAEIQVHRHGLYDEPLNLHVYMTKDDQGGESEVARVTLREAGWVSVNVTAPVLSWLIFPNTNFGLRLAVTSLDRKHERRFHEVGVSGAKDEEDYRPFMVGFFALPSLSFKKKRIRTTRSVSAPPRNPQRSYRDIADQPHQSDTLCRMKHLHVSFRDLGWENWVIAPEGYDANYCEGHCVFPLQAELNATNHALVQTLVKVIDGVPEDQEVPPNACCAPIDLATIPVLYYSYENNIVLKKYPKMIVKTCGCL